RTNSSKRCSAEPRCEPRGGAYGSEAGGLHLDGDETAIRDVPQRGCDRGQMERTACADGCEVGLTQVDMPQHVCAGAEARGEIFSRQLRARCVEVETKPRGSNVLHQA